MMPRRHAELSPETRARVARVVRKMRALYTRDPAAYAYACHVIERMKDGLSATDARAEATAYFGWPPRLPTTPTKRETQ